MKRRHSETAKQRRFFSGNKGVSVFPRYNLQAHKGHRHSTHAVRALCSPTTVRDSTASDTIGLDGRGAEAGEAPSATEQEGLEANGSPKGAKGFLSRLSIQGCRMSDPHRLPLQRWFVMHNGKGSSGCRHLPKAVAISLTGTRESERRCTE